MNTDITYSYQYIDTDRFESQYEDELQIDKEERKDIILNGIVVYLHTKQGLVGECYGATPQDLAWIEDGEELPDTNPDDNESIYVYSTTVLPQFQGQGYGTLLTKEFASHVSNMGYVKLVGHATTPAMRKIRENQGAIMHSKGIHTDWYGTSRTAHFYTQFLTQDKDYNCGPMALAYLLETREYTYTVEDLEDELLTDMYKGTDPENILRFLDRENIGSKVIKELSPNSIIDIFDEDDGHWIVLIEKCNDVWRTYDPLKGICLKSHKDLLNTWYSNRYGKGKGFQIL